MSTQNLLNFDFGDEDDEGDDFNPQAEVGSDDDEKPQVIEDDDDDDVAATSRRSRSRSRPAVDEVKDEDEDKDVAAVDGEDDERPVDDAEDEDKPPLDDEEEEDGEGVQGNGEVDEDEDEDDDDEDDDLPGQPTRKRRKHRRNRFDMIWRLRSTKMMRRSQRRRMTCLSMRYDPDDLQELPADADRDDRKHRELDRQREAKEQESAEEQAQRFVERYGRKERTTGAAGAAVPQRLLLPGPEDPQIFRLKCRPGKERDIIQSINQRILDRMTSREPRRINSAFERGGVMAGNIYVEAKRQEDVHAAVDGVSHVFGHKALMIPIEEMPDLLKTRKTKQLEPGMYVRIKRVGGIKATWRKWKTSKGTAPTSRFALSRA